MATLSDIIELREKFKEIMVFSETDKKIMVEMKIMNSLDIEKTIDKDMLESSILIWFHKLVSTLKELDGMEEVK